MSALVYFIGEPGAGKSTLMRNLTADYTASPQTKPFAHTLYRKDTKLIAAQLGADHPTFPGTDKLSMGIQPQAIQFLRTQPAPIVLAEGDRLGNLKFLQAAYETHAVILVYCDIDPSEAFLRRAQRGTNQNPTWLKGRQTKVTNLWNAWQGIKLHLNMTEPTTELVNAVKNIARLP